jgi:putative PEP-CTERM system histidine kinase
MATELLYAGIVGHFVAAAAYLLLGALLVYWRNSTLAGVMLVAASFVTCLWAASTGYDLVNGAVQPAAEALQTAQSCAWMLLALSRCTWLSPVERSTWAAIAIAFAICVMALTLSFGESTQTSQAGGSQLAVMMGHVAVAIFGTVIAENLLRNSPPSDVWKVKYLCFAAGALFVYDFFLYSDALLFRRIDSSLLLARGPIALAVAPLFVVYAERNRVAGPQVALSHRFAFQSASLIGAGVYLMVVAAGGYYVRQFGGTWSIFLDALFLFGALLLLVLPIASGTFRAYLRVLVEKSFFKYKYDYRAEWLRFIRTMSIGEPGVELGRRVIQAVCDIIDSPDGALWRQRESGKYSLVSSLNLTRWALNENDAVIDSDSSLIGFLKRSQWIVDLDEFARTPQHYNGLTELPEWLRSASRAWLIVPLILRERLVGVIVVGRARARRDLTWEDFDLLKTVGRQAASYLCEEETSEALAEARQFEAFNRRFTFIAHDIKNLASQLSLIVANAARHRNNEAFQRDAHETLRRSVDKLNKMLHQLSTPLQSELSSKPIALAPLLQDIVTSRRDLVPAVSLNVNDDKIAVAADEQRLKAIIEHLLQNALEAVGRDGCVQVRLSSDEGAAVLEIEDSGPGMAPEFVRDKLFRPFATTKGSGYGIGAYESREYAVSLGGRLEVESQPGRGTIMRVSFPRLPAGSAGGSLRDTTHA